jgi:hypothetical protein
LDSDSQLLVQLYSHGIAEQHWIDGQTDTFLHAFSLSDSMLIEGRGIELLDEMCVLPFRIESSCE